MEQKNISFGYGIHRTPTLGNDGQLSECVNLIPENGELVNIQPSKPIGITLEGDETLMAVHKTSAFTHYILLKEYVTKDIKITIVINAGNIIEMYSTDPVTSERVDVPENIHMRFFYTLEGAPSTVVNYTDSGITKGSNFGSLQTDQPIASVTKVEVTVNEYLANYSFIFVPTSSVVPPTIDDIPGQAGTSILEYIDSEDETMTRVTISTSPIGSLKSVTVMGNTLVVNTVDGLTYDLWKDGEYVLLGGQPPFLDLSFGLAYNKSYTNHGNIDVVNYADTLIYRGSGGLTPENFFREVQWGDGTSSTSKSTKEKNEALNASIATAITGFVDEAFKEAEDDSKFVSPFFIRYAYRTYTGTMMVSPPVLLIPCSGDTIISATPSGVTPSEAAAWNKFHKFSVDVSLSAYDIFYVMNNVEEIKAELAKWNDIISGVEIYVSRQVNRYNPNGEFKSLAMYGYKPTGTSGDSSSSTDDEGLVEEGDAYLYDYFLGESWSTISSDITTLEASRHDAQNAPDGYDGKYVAIGFRKSDSQFFKEIREIGNYYKVCSILVKNLQEKKRLVLEKGTLSSLEARTQLKDSLYSNDNFIPEVIFAYNSRLHIGNIRREFHGFGTETMMAFTNCTHNGTTASHPNLYKYDLYITAIEDGQRVVVKNPGGMNLLEPPTWLYYPNMHVQSAVLVRQRSSGTNLVYAPEYADLEFTEHSLLKGCYYFNELEDITFETVGSDDVIPEGGNYVKNANAVYVSEAANPFSFDTSGMNNVGMGEILGLSTAAKALSSGTEFGSSPLLCFCTDGIWPMQITGEGTYTSIKPLTRDVCTNPAAILQLDDAVAFVTNRGLMITDGSERNTMLVSEQIHGHNDNERILFNLIDGFNDLVREDDINFVEMLQDCQMVYDSSNGMIRIYPMENTGKHFVYKIAAREFSSYVGEDADIVTVAPGYPLPTVQLTDGSLATYDKLFDDTTIRRGLLLTRPTAFGNPVAMKMLADLRLSYSRYSFGTKCRVAVFVSNDRLRWYKLKSLYAHSYKWFRFAVFTRMTDVDAFEGIVTMIENRRDNKIR